MRAGLGAVLVTALLLGACGTTTTGGQSVAPSTSGPGTSGPGTEGPGASAAPQGRDGELTVVVDDGAGTTSTWTLTCAGGVPGGDHPDPAGACAAIEARRDPFAPVPKDRACTMVYGGPQRADVRGTWAGRTVTAVFDRTDGCQIARWDALAAVLQPGVPVESVRGGS